MLQPFALVDLLAKRTKKIFMIKSQKCKFLLKAPARRPSFDGV